MLPKVISDKIGQLKGTDIQAKSARAVVALSIGTVAGRSMRFIRSMILARILAPDQIGMMALVMSFSVAFEALTEVGVKQSIIQNKQGAHADYLNVAWWMQVVRGLCLFGIAVFLAPWISSFYDNPELLNLLRVSFIAIVLKGFVSPRAYVLEKEYKFGRAVFLIQGSAILGAIITVGLAFVMRNVWALAIGFVMEMALLSVLSFLLVPFMPSFKLDRKCLSELLKYSRGIFGLPILNALSFQAPILILGKVISSHQLGLYSFAAMFAYIPTDLYIRIINPVLLPAFSEKQDDKRALCRGLFRATRYTAFLIMPLIAFMICSSTKLLGVVYGPRYVAMAVPFAILCLLILARSETSILAGMYMAVGKPHLQRRFSAVRTAIIIAFIYPAAVRFGPIGAVVVVVLGNYSVLLLQVFKARKVFDLELSRYICSYIPGLLAALPIMVTAGLLWGFRVDFPPLVLAISVLVLITTFTAGVFIMNRAKETLQSRNNPRIS
jgi:O-antigen/teichoic acid export membrane protein